MLKLIEMKWWYYFIASVLSLYYAYRGFIGNKIAVEERNAQPLTKRKVEKWEYISVYCIGDAIFHFISSIAGFLSMAIAYHAYQSIDFQKGFETGNAILFVFLLLFGIVGITGQLPSLIQQGKLPWIPK
jgi:hypothetical protein